jgi:hypothetical protein
MKDAGIFFGFFFVIIIMAAVVGQDGKGIFETTSSSTPSYAETPGTDSGYGEPSYSSPEPAYSQGDYPPPAPELSPREIEEKVAAIYRELDQLKEELRDTRLREPASPHRNKVTLSSGSVYTDDPNQEYLVLRAESSNTSGVTISDWYLESYVTDEAASIPEGDRIIERWRSPQSEAIVLLPGETAYLITGDSPIDTSFRENMCTGYLNEYETFYPYLNRSCPYPMDELKRFGDIDLDNDRCYDFVERLGTCVTPEDETYERREVGSTCSMFVENTFNYNDCVRLHRYDPFFVRDGYWRIYLEERNELWRSEREIIRLMDEADRVIAVLEY